MDWVWGEVGRSCWVEVELLGGVMDELGEGVGGRGFIFWRLDMDSVT